ncbi:family 16 glycoside hydrolase [Nocardioides bruguierae]|uniref:Ig-like domain-containing protein n=1 Tax=Nocardioides bruguierae TaxID=2945102 RepID=A0A9X2D7H8_9ACTN|nr:family 16 glycoside hydrolase [Nocardioides bruguierae]MCM0620688.1 Ig-like domain-containing protein [Nocardioides bruguierae]
MQPRAVRPPRSAALVALAGLLAGLLSVVLPPPAAVAADGDVIAWVEVEDGVISGGPAFNSGDHGNFSGTGSHTFRETGMTSTMSVTAPEAGTYPLYVRYAAGPLGPDENVTRSMGLLTNGGDRQQLSLPMTSYENWEAWDFVAAEVTLQAGANTIALACDRSIDFCRLNFDAIQVGGTAPDACTATPVAPGWAGLFDGTFTSFDGWRKAGLGGFGRQTDCTILSVRGRGATWATQQLTAPYTLRLDWLREGLNDDSAVHLGSTGRAGADPVGGVSVLIGADGAGIRTADGTLHPAGAEAATAEHPTGQWNTYTLRVTTTGVEVLLDDVVVNAWSGTLPTTGFIGLQNRSSTDQVRFRDVQVRPGVAPVGVADSYATDADVTLEVEAPGVLSNDTDADGSPLTAAVVDQPAHGVLTLAKDGSFTYAPETGFVGSDAFTYAASDGVESAAPTTVTLTVAEVADATELSAAAEAFAYGRRGAVRVTLAPSANGGDVEVLEGGTLLGSVPVADGAASVPLARKALRPGLHALTVRYTGTPSWAASSTVVDVRVRKARPRMTVRAPQRVRLGRRARVRVDLAAGRGVPVAGRVRVAAPGLAARTQRLRGGETTFRLPRARRVGRTRLTVTYLGSRLVARTTQRATIRVTR